MEALPGAANRTPLPQPTLPSTSTSQAPTLTTIAQVEPSEVSTVAVAPTAEPLLTLEPSPAPLLTIEPTATVELPTVEVPTAAPPLPTLSIATPAAQTNEERWRARQIGREVFPGLQGYSTLGSELWWFDPLNQQSIILGSITGPFDAQAKFVLRGQGVEALEVPYRINVSYGLTALSPAILDRIYAAGYTEWIETYVFITANVSPR